jgi:hypothetical protein
MTDLKSDRRRDMPAINRRHFLYGSGLAVGAALVGTSTASANAGMSANGSAAVGTFTQADSPTRVGRRYGLRT